MQVLVDEVLAGAVPKAPRERVDVSLRRRRVRQRPRVLVDSERESRRLERARRELPLREDSYQRGRQGSVGRDDRRVVGQPIREQLLSVMVEEHLLDGRVERDALELTEP